MFIKVIIFYFKFNFILTALIKSPGSSLVLRNSDHRLPTLRACEPQPQTIQKQPTTKKVRYLLNKHIDNNVARKTYEQFLSK